MKRIINLLIALIVVFSATAQTKDSLKVKYSAYIDFYYAYDLNQPTSELRQPFLVSYNRHNQMRLNIASVSAEIARETWRSKVTLQTGTFAKDNYVAEPSKYLGAIQEANVGFVLGSEKKTWLDFGVFTSHIGYESAIGADNWTLTRSLVSELTPYFLSGAKITHNKGKLTYSAIVCNSWSTLFGYKKGQLPSFGTQITKRRNEKTTLNWSTFLGSGVRDGFKEFRFYNNFYAIWQPTTKDQMIVGLDLGYQQKIAPEKGYNNWFVPSIIFRRKMTRDLFIAARAELFFDEFGVVVPAVDSHAFDVFSPSFNLDYTFTENGLLRFEARMFSSSGPYFYQKNGLTAQSNFVTMAMTKKF